MIKKGLALNMLFRSDFVFCFYTWNASWHSIDMFWPLTWGGKRETTNATHAKFDTSCNHDFYTYLFEWLCSKNHYEMLKSEEIDGFGAVDILQNRWSIGPRSLHSCFFSEAIYQHDPLIICSIAMENHHRNSVFSITKSDFPVRYVANYQRLNKLPEVE